VSFSLDNPLILLPARNSMIIDSLRY
jgi:hypothetical protein